MSNSTSLHQLISRTANAIAEVKKAFGAPGDFGYGTPEGRALLELYNLRPVLNASLGLANRADAQPPLVINAELLATLKEARQQFWDDNHSHMTEERFAEEFAWLDGVIAKAEGRT